MQDNNIVASDAPAPLVPEGDAWAYIRHLNDRLAVLEHRHGYIQNAFPRNDLDKPDYDGHRKAHLDLMKQDEVVDSYKQEATKKIVSMLTGAILTLLGMGLLEYLKK